MFSVSLDWFKGELERLEEEIRAGRIARYQRVERLREAISKQPFPNSASKSSNVYSSVEYHSIQFTCRQMIRIPGDRQALSSMVETLRREGDATVEEVADELLSRIDRLTETRFFFPFEVQILDAESYRISREGRASHDVYKTRQRQAVKLRVLGDLVDAGSKKSDVDPAPSHMPNLN